MKDKFIDQYLNFSATNYPLLISAISIILGIRSKGFIFDETYLLIGGCIFLIMSLYGRLLLLENKIDGK